MSIVRDYGLGWTLLALFLSSWAGQWLTHDGTVQEFFNATMENWQSEFLQLLTFVVLSKYQTFKDSPQSRDGDDRLHRLVEAIAAKLTVRRS